jgi:hypothetical protein
VDVGNDYESIAKYWIAANKKHVISNGVSSAVLWSLWKLRNELCFSGSCLVGSEDGVDPDFKNAKKVVEDAQAGSWSAARRAGLQSWKSYQVVQRSSSGWRISQ